MGEVASEVVTGVATRTSVEGLDVGCMELDSYQAAVALEAMSQFWQVGNQREWVSRVPPQDPRPCAKGYQIRVPVADWAEQHSLLVEAEVCRIKDRPLHPSTSQGEYFPSYRRLSSGL